MPISKVFLGYSILMPFFGIGAVKFFGSNVEFIAFLVAFFSQVFVHMGLIGITRVGRSSQHYKRGVVLANCISDHVAFRVFRCDSQ